MVDPVEETPPTSTLAKVTTPLAVKFKPVMEMVPPGGTLAGLTMIVGVGKGVGLGRAVGVAVGLTRVFVAVGTGACNAPTPKTEK